MYDTIGFISVDDTTGKDFKEVELDGLKLKNILTRSGEVYYDWDHGMVVYMVFLSVLFMATIVLEGVDTSIMAKVTPRKLNEQFVNAGLLATLIGTLGRVVADTILTGESTRRSPFYRHYLAHSAMLDCHFFSAQ